uniref:Protein ARV n=1 Tax=Brugia malayi TaxID=6279 RepID=A0A1I9G350_BRUMA|nr:Bm5235, isoform b [Brugia malayi]
MTCISFRNEVEGTRGMVDEYICINCCHPSSSLFLKYSDNGIRLTPCSNCGRAVDAYIEYDIVLVIIDLMLQYIEAYRHFLMNTGNNRVSFTLFRMQIRMSE